MSETSDTLTLTYRKDDPFYIVSTNDAYANLTDDNGNVLDLVADFARGYAEALLWANTYTNVSEDDYMDVDGENAIECVDLSYAYISPGDWFVDIGIDYFDAIDFLAANFGTLATVGGSAQFGKWEQHGHDFALTRNGHGTGFWDRGYSDVGDTLTDAAKAYGSHNLFVDADDDKITNE